MKILLVLGLASLLGAPQAFSYPLTAPQSGVTVVRDSSSTNIPTTYTTGAALATTLAKVSHLFACNTSATDVALSFATITTNCASAADNLILLHGTCTPTVGPIFINSHLCARSLGSAINSGLIYVNLW